MTSKVMRGTRLHDCDGATELAAWPSQAYGRATQLRHSR